MSAFPPLYIPISIHPPRAGRDLYSHFEKPVNQISIHPPRAGRDEMSLYFITGIRRFQSTRPVRGGTLVTVSSTTWQTFQSTRPVRGGTMSLPSRLLLIAISIHPPRAGRDQPMFLWFCATFISIHPPRAGRDDDCQDIQSAVEKFQSTRPVRGGTLPYAPLAVKGRISIHPPRAGRDLNSVLVKPRQNVISIHPPRAGRDGAGALFARATMIFQSTRPVRGGTFTCLK